jgi:SAM-dependent methyltransferase
MHQHVVDLNTFYLTRLGRVARRMIGHRIREIWPDTRQEVVLGLGYAVPFLGPFREEAERVFAIMPPGQGIMAWPESGPRQVALADDDSLPFPDGSIDRILIVHGLEFSEQRRPMLEEVWRVMRPGGRILVLVPNRHGLWARAEATPFGHGYPFSASQLTRLLRDHRFAPVASGKTLFFPPIGLRTFLRTAAVWQRVGQHLGRLFGGVVYVEADKTVFEARPIATRARRRVFMPVPEAAPAGARVASSTPLRRK